VWMPICQSVCYAGFTRVQEAHQLADGQSAGSGGGRRGSRSALLLSTPSPPHADQALRQATVPTRAPLLFKSY